MNRSTDEGTDVTHIVKNESVNLQQLYHDHSDGEQKKSPEDENISSPEVSQNSSQMRNDSAFNISDEGIFTSQVEEYLLLKELQNSNTCKEFKQYSRHSHVC